MSRKTLTITAFAIIGLAIVLFFMQYLGGFGAASVIGGLRETPEVTTCQDACTQSCFEAGGDSSQCETDCTDFCADTP